MDLAVVMRPEVLADKLEDGRVRGRGVATWNTRRLPTRLTPGWTNRLFVASQGRWRGYVFSGISGSTVADVSAVASTTIPAMVRAGYSRELAVAIVSAASAIGILVPPCILMIYAIVIVALVGIGLFLPPVGVGLFIACGIAGVSVDRATRAVLPFIAVLCVGLGVIIVAPWFTLVLPRLFKVL